MVDPRIALLSFAAFVAGAAFLFWPRFGVFSRLRRWRRAGRRVSMEDALKHLYKCERRSVPASMESLAGALESGQHGAARVLGLLRDAGLVRADRPLSLTERGRSYALRIIRTHRLWERYLADRTGVAPGEWHASAEEREHWLSSDDVETLASRLGHPRYDPHGDPIPTATGEIPEPVGIALTRLGAGQEAVVLHLEDEPESTYDRLVAAGLSPGLSLRVLDRAHGALRLDVDGRQVEVDSVDAENVTVDPGAEALDALAGALTLEDLEPGETAEVVGLSPACQGIQRRRLLDLGIVPGTPVTSELSSVTGDPVAYLVRGALIALRRNQQRWIRVRRERDEEAA
jgi:DtxR family Mn-dependent transcriptional regulator